MWYYAGNGWFFRRQPGDIFEIVVTSGEATDPPADMKVLAQTTIDGDTFVRLLSHLSQKSRLTVLEFLRWEEPAQPG